MRLVLYGKPGCHLCDRLQAMLEPHLAALRQRRGEVVLVKRNIEDDPAWMNRYRYRIPVLTVDDRVVLEGRPAPQDVAQALTALVEN